MDKQKILASLLALLLLAGGAYFFLDRGYGEVGPQGYAYSKALFMACNQKDKDRLAKISEMVNSDLEQGAVSAQESEWLLGIVKLGLEENWKQASQEVRQLMNDQIRLAE
ncbi:MAG: hypothetical protein AAF483_12950 [Planctomycetota bacterium]